MRAADVHHGATVAVAFHGAGGGAWEWAVWRRVWEARGVDFRPLEFVAGARSLADTSFEDYVAQALDATTGANRPILVGASLGGLIALRIAERARASAIVLVNPVPPSGLAMEEPPPVRRWSTSPLINTLEALPDGDYWAARFAHERWRDESGRVLATVRRGIEFELPATPALVMAGTADCSATHRTSRLLADRLGADFVSLRGASHLGPLLGKCAPEAARLALDWIG